MVMLMDELRLADSKEEHTGCFLVSSAMDSVFITEHRFYSSFIQLYNKAAALRAYIFQEEDVLWHSSRERAAGTHSTPHH